MDEQLKVAISGKHVLLIAPKFYGYEEIIEKELINYGADVYLIYENLEITSCLYRVINLYLHVFVPLFQSKYYSKAIKKISFVPDYIFVIRGSSLNRSILEHMHLKWPDSIFIMYQWDSIKNNANANRIESYFDYKYTFDFMDAKEKKWIYRPLFFMNPLFAEKEYDIAYICTLHSERLKIYEELLRIKNKFNLNCYFYIFIRRLTYLKRKYLNRDKKYYSRRIDRQDIHFIPLELEKTKEIYAKTKIIVDYTNSKQCGLTIRTIESLGNNCKLITNNKLIKEADFYDARNIFIYENNVNEIPEPFLKEVYTPIHDEIKARYTVGAWLKDIFIIKRES